VYGNARQAFEAGMVSVSPITQDNANLRMRMNVDPERIRAYNAENVAGIAGWSGARGRAEVNVPYNQPELVLSAVALSRVPLEKAVLPRWPSQTPMRLSKLIGHPAIIPTPTQLGMI
jgi:hypothetical protein